MEPLTPKRIEPERAEPARIEAALSLAHQAAQVARVLGERRQAPCGPAYDIYDDLARWRIRVAAEWPNEGQPLIVQHGRSVVLRLTGMEVGWYRHDLHGWEMALMLLAQLAALPGARKRIMPAGRRPEVLDAEEVSA